MTPQTQALIGQAVQFLQSGQPERAESILKKILEVQKNNLPALEILGLIKGSQGKHTECAEYLKKAVKINPHNPGTQYNLAKAYSESDNQALSIKHYLNTVALDPKNSDAWNNLGELMVQSGQNEKGIQYFERAIQSNSNYFNAKKNIIFCLLNNSKNHEALLKIEEFTVNNKINIDLEFYKSRALFNLGQFNESLEVLKKIINIDPNNNEYLHQILIVSQKLKFYDEALIYASKLLSQNQSSHSAWSDKGCILAELKRHHEAIFHYEHSLSLKRDNSVTLHNLGLSYFDIGKFDLSAKFMEEALNLDPNIKYANGAIIFSKLMLGDYFNIDNLINKVLDSTTTNNSQSSPFCFLPISTSPELELKVAKDWVANNFVQSIEKITNKPEHISKIRIGYYSTDFKSHPVSLLLEDVFKNHDRQLFEIHGFSLAKVSKNDPMNLRIRSNFDFFHDVDELSDFDVTKKSRELNINIAIDLNGHTQFSRHGVFINRSAPIQINFFGYPGSSGSPEIDYIISDETIISEDMSCHFSEKVIRLPSSLLIDSRKNQVTQKFSRADFGLPDEAFIFCSFNNAYKFNPHILKLWSKILLAVPNSVVWLAENSSLFLTNIQNYFSKLGIDSSRVIFATKLPDFDQHISRMSLANLFLDTYPYNAHTTTLDAIRAQLPVLTKIGNTFSSRVAASILNQIDLNELVVDCDEDYFLMAVDLATHPEKLSRLKAKVTSDSCNTLYDTKTYAKNLESIYLDLLRNKKAPLN